VATTSPTTDKPDASRSSGSLVDDLVRCETRLYNAMNDRLREAHGIVTSQFEFLRYVRDHPGARVADIAAMFAIGIGATSKGMDRLADRGLLARIPNPGDRRSSLLELTPAGRDLVDAAEKTFEANVGSLLGSALTAEQIQAVAEALATLRSDLESKRVGLPVG
jgi:DNA-binding MarR family transcriptional regulator